MKNGFIGYHGINIIGYAPFFSNLLALASYLVLVSNKL